MEIRIGLIGIVREELRQDFWGTLKKVREIGYEGWETSAGVVEQAGCSAEELRKRLNDIGLSVVTLHSQKFRIREHGVDWTLDTARALGSEMITMSWGPCESVDQLKADAELYNDLGRRCKERGLQLTYHNHNHEFATFDGRTGFDILMGAADPDLLHAQLDVAWATWGGVDPAAVIRQYAGRMPALHAKDISASPEGGQTSNDGRKEVPFTEVGTGVVDFPRIVEAARESGVKWMSVEQDRLADLPAMESIRVSYENLRGLLG